MNGTLPMFRALVAAILFGSTAVAAETTVSVASLAPTTSFQDAQTPGNAIPAAVLRDITNWHRLRSGQGSLDDALSFLERRGDWPGLKLLRKRMEPLLPIGRRADDVIRFFGTTVPQTGRGARALIAAHRARGDLDTAHDLAILTWRTMVLSEADEDALLGAYGSLLADHHEARLDMLLWRNAETSVDRMLPRVSEDLGKLAAARLGLRAKKSGVDALIEAVPAKLQADPGLTFERMQWRARKGRTADAIALMLATNADALGQPQRWAGWRRSFARAEMRAGRPDRAYKLASEHGLISGSHFADLEWLSGYISLTYQKNGAKALEHFLRFRGAVETPISLGRAGYWEGRAHELLGDTENARLAYAFGAEYQTSFYGLLAADRIDAPLDPALTGLAIYPDWRQTSFAESSVLQAAQSFLSRGQRHLAEQFLRHMTETLPAEEIGSLGDYVLSQHEPHLAVMIGKQAARRGIVIPKAYYPVASLGLLHDPVPQELTLAIARRESEFDHSVESGAGAKGLMQVMPATARAVASYLQVPYERDRLLADPAYNARLGTAYLDELMAKFSGNIVMVAAGYNAGPGRPIRWMRERGDPRRGAVDIVDWIEHIPFDETRNYVMRVAESLPVYRARLSGQVHALDFAEELMARPGHKRQAIKGSFQRPEPRPEPLTD